MIKDQNKRLAYRIAHHAIANALEHGKGTHPKIDRALDEIAMSMWVKADLLGASTVEELCKHYGVTPHYEQE